MGDVGQPNLQFEVREGFSSADWYWLPICFAFAFLRLGAFKITSTGLKGRNVPKFSTSAANHLGISLVYPRKLLPLLVFSGAAPTRQHQ